MGVRNALIAVNGSEIPVLDGSALAMAEAIFEVGVVSQGEPCPTIRLTEPLYVEHGEARGLALPSDRFRLTVAVRFPEPVGCQVVDFPDPMAAFVENIAPARTPGFASEWEKLKALGLALGASEDNVLPILDDRYGAPERVRNEVAAHKALDLIGDLALLGAQPLAHIVTTHGGHALNHALARAIRDGQER